MSETQASEPGPAETQTMGSGGEEANVEVVDHAKLFGTFHGVFRPTLLTILGALLYLREGWVIGHAGLGGFVVILGMMYVITGCTSLSLATITTNIRIGKGGVFSIISQSIGLEAGGAIGIPFYLAQALGGAMYMYAFAEGWRAIFPTHPTPLVIAGVFTVAMGLSMVSARLAFRVQSVVLLGIIVALVSAALGLRDFESPPSVELWGSFEGTSMVALFALFFPAATGIMVGASMSGNLARPRRSIPSGTLAAWGVSLAVYLLIGVWYALVATPAELRGSYTIMVEKAAWGPGVLLGLLSSTFSATLSSIVAAPRVLQALGSHDVLPAGAWFAATNARGEPRNASIVTAVIIGLGLMSGSLDAIAPLLTIFFLITYASINLVVSIEQSLGLISFRPLFRVPRMVPIVGTVASLLAIMATSPIVGIISFVIVLGVYTWLVSRSLKTPYETVRSGLFVNIADWAAKKVASLPDSSERSWKPDIMVPVRSATEISGLYRLLRSLTWPKGSIKLIGLAVGGDGGLSEGLAAHAQDFEDDGIFTSWADLDAADFGSGTVSSLSIMKGAFFPPNIVLVSIPGKSTEELERIRALARDLRVGLILYAPHPQASLGRERIINLWVREQSPDWKLQLKMASIDLSLLIALQLQQSWDARINLICVVRDAAQVPNAHGFLDVLREEARIPGRSQFHVLSGSFTDQVSRAPQADINIFGMPATVSPEWMAAMMENAKSSCLFVMASGRESAIA